MHVLLDCFSGDAEVVTDPGDEGCEGLVVLEQLNDPRAHRVQTEHAAALNVEEHASIREFSEADRFGDSEHGECRRENSRTGGRDMPLSWRNVRNSTVGQLEHRSHKFGLRS